MIICKKFHKEDLWCLSYKAALHGIYGLYAQGKRETGANPVRTRHRDREQEPQNHWETGKMADAMILSRETCLNAVQKRKFQTTSKKVVRLDLQN